MYGKFVGLDIGSDSIKITLIRRGLRDTKLLQTIQLKTPESSQAISRALGKVFAENPDLRGDISTSLLSNPISIRVLNFPFSDPKKIDEVYEFELENVSTFDPMDKVHGYHLVKRGNEGEAIVCMFEKEDMRNLLSICEGTEIDPKVVTFAPVAFSALDGFLSGERPLLLINIGASKMSFSLFDREGIRRVRASSKAGKIVTEAISRTLRVSFEEAESIKQGGVKSDKSLVLREAFAPILDEIKKTTQFFELELKEEIKTVLLSGGMSLMPGIGDYIGRELRKDVRMLFVPDLGRDNSPVYAESFALALYGSALKRGNLNLRKGEFKYTGRGEELRRTFMVPALLLSLLIILSLYRSGARYFEFRDRVEKMETQVERDIKEMFPNVRVIPKPVEFMEGEVKKVRDKLRLIEGVSGGATPLDVLRDISISIPSNIKLTVDEINFVDDGTVRVQGKCNSSEEVAKIEKALSDSGLFKKVIRNSTETAANNTIKFQISLVLDTGA
jgi:type IV pilus assembly protein PilM